MDKRCVLITGSLGLVGSETARLFGDRGLHVLGIDNDQRQAFFGPEGSTAANRQTLREAVSYEHFDLDIRDRSAIETLFEERGGELAAIIHCAAQPSHDWAARDPHVDFSVNAVGTLVLLEAARRHAPETPFVFTSTNKVYGDRPNDIPLEEGELRWEPPTSHPYHEHGIDEQMSIDATKHSVFGASKVAADVMVQEYGRYFDMPTGVFRGGCITGAAHSSVPLHGFLAYVMKCVASGRPYTVIGYEGKQVRDNIHAHDLAAAFWEFCQAPKAAAIYNVGGGRERSCSVREAIALCEEATGRVGEWRYEPQARSGDHIWYISDVRKLQRDYPGWRPEYSLQDIIQELARGTAG